ncbi:hypothetical protein PMm318_A36580 [Pseudomonas moorei]
MALRPARRAGFGQWSNLGESNRHWLDCTEHTEGVSKPVLHKPSYSKVLFLDVP